METSVDVKYLRQVAKDAERQRYFLEREEAKKELERLVQSDSKAKEKISFLERCGLGPGLILSRVKMPPLPPDYDGEKVTREYMELFKQREDEERLTAEKIIAQIPEMVLEAARTGKFKVCVHDLNYDKLDYQQSAELEPRRYSFWKPRQNFLSLQFVRDFNLCGVAKIIFEYCDKVGLRPQIICERAKDGKENFSIYVRWF